MGSIPRVNVDMGRLETIGGQRPEPGEAAHRLPLPPQMSLCDAELQRKKAGDDRIRPGHPSPASYMTR